tara:strand:- start:363 stop:644 length:282 start_codon:yes stop_codon:yes gene_type:complete
MSRRMSMFDIDKFCEKSASGSSSGSQSCQNVTYKKMVTAGNDPSISQKMRYSQYIQTTKPRTSVVIAEDTYQKDTNIPYYYFTFGFVRPYPSK